MNGQQQVDLERAENKAPSHFSLRTHRRRLFNGTNRLRSDLFWVGGRKTPTDRDQWPCAFWMPHSCGSLVTSQKQRAPAVVLGTPTKVVETRDFSPTKRALLVKMATEHTVGTLGYVQFFLAPHIRLVLKKRRLCGNRASSAAASIHANGCSTHKVTCVVVGSWSGRAATVVLTSGYSKHGEKSPRSVVDMVVSVASFKKKKRRLAD